MGVVNTLSNLITNADASPAVMSPPHLAHGRVRSAVATVETAAADDDGSVYRMVRLWSGWRVNRIDLLNDAITSGTAYDVGIYQTAANGGAVVDDDVFATAVDLSSARVAPLDVLFEALNIDKIEKQLWEVLPGLTSDPGRWYDLCLTADTVGSAAGTISLRVEYVVD